MTNILKGSELQYSRNISMGEFFFNCGERFGDKICQVDATTDKKESYSSVKERSVRVALQLQKKGITCKDVVALCTKTTLDNLIPIVASFYLGAKVANLEPLLSVRQTTHLLALVSPKIIFVEEQSVDLIEESLKSANLRADIVVFGKTSKHSTFSDFLKPSVNEKDFKPTEVDIHNTSIILFSSGTTGLPKAICHSHYSFLNVAHSFYQTNGRCETILSFTSFYWMSGLLILICSFIAGGSRILCGTIDSEKTFRVIEKYKVTFLFLAPILTYKLTSFERYHEYDTSSLFTMLVGGTPLSTAQFDRIRTVFKHTNLIFGYGLTEAGVVIIFEAVKDQQLIQSKIGSCGKPAPGMIFKVADVSTNKALGPNQKGELCVKSPTMMTGYYHADSTAAFDSEGFLRTGDIGYYDKDECFYVIERMKEMFKYLSWHVVPSAIEAVLLEHPAVKEVAVFGTPRSEEEGEVPTACVVLKENCKIAKGEIEEFVAGKVSDYEKLRGGVFFVEELQKTPSGKLMRKEIRNSVLNKNLY